MRNSSDHTHLEEFVFIRNVIYSVFVPSTSSCVRVCAHMCTCLSIPLSFFLPLTMGKCFHSFSKYLVEISGGSLCTKHPFLAEDDLPHLGGDPLIFCHLPDVCRVSGFPRAGYLRPFLFLSCESFCRLVKANDSYRESALSFALMLL